MDFYCECSCCQRQTASYRIFWWEKRLIHWGLTMIVALSSWWLLYGGIRIVPNFWNSFAGVMSALGGLILDIYFTQVTLKLKPEFEKRGIPFPVEEGNRLLPKYPTLRQQIFSLPVFTEIPSLVLVYFIPPVGFAVGALHLMAVLSWALCRKNMLDDLQIHKYGRQNLWLGGEGTPVPNS